MHADDIEAVLENMDVFPRGAPIIPLSPSKSFSKLRFGKDNLFRRSRSLDAGSLPQRIVNYREDEDEDSTWQIGSRESLPARTDSFDDLVIISTIGTGSFGRVKLVRSLSDGRHFALKVLQKAELMRLKQVQHVLDEKKLLLEIRHPFIVTLHNTFKDDYRLYMQMDYVSGGELFRHLRSAGRFETDTARFYIACVISAIEHMHSHDIIYRDLKPENILLTKSGYLKIADFGFAKKVMDRTWTLCGTPEYLAPEIIENKGHGKGVDWWAVGILLFEMLAGHPPFYDQSAFLIYKRVLSGKLDFPFHMDQHAKDLIKRLLTKDTNLRLGCTPAGAVAVRTHPFFRSIDWMFLTEGRIKPPFTPRVSSPSDTRNFDKVTPSLEGAERSAQLTVSQAEDAFREF